MLKTELESFVKCRRPLVPKRHAARTCQDLKQLEPNARNGMINLFLPFFSGEGGAASAIICFSYSFNRLSSAGHRIEFILWSVIFELSSCHSCQSPSVYWIHPNNADSPLSVFSFRVLLDWSQWRTNLWRSTGLLWLRNQCNMYLSQQN